MSKSQKQIQIVNDEFQTPLQKKVNSIIKTKRKLERRLSVAQQALLDMVEDTFFNSFYQTPVMGV